MQLKIFLTCLFLTLKTLLSQTVSIERFISLKINVNDFSINENKNFIILISNETNEVIKINLDGEIQKIIGGFGWGESQFDYPSSITSTAIEIYVADFNNHRIQRFDHNLNFISSLSSSDNIKFEYPISITLSSKGDLYILDSKNKKVLKINSFKKLERVFGNYESGNVILAEPKLIKLDSSQRIYVLDKDQILVFDEFGSFIKKIPIPEKLKNEIVDFQVYQNSIYFLTERNLYEFKNELTQIFIDNEIIGNSKLKKFEIRLNKIYLLTDRGILICKKEN
ncbi:MAG: NHL repeat-containing protein [Ignavibacteria bacterium]